VISRFAIPDRIMFVEALDKKASARSTEGAARKYGDG